jgi:hypothetical protein
MRKLVISFLLIVITCSVAVSKVNYFAFAHTFSGDESATFLALIEMIKTEAHLAQQNLLTNVTLAQEHAQATTEHLDANQTKEISERNKRVSNELNDSLTALKNAFNSTNPPTISDINGKVNNIDAILGEVLSVRIDKNQLNNVTVKALTINDLVGETLEHYGEAVGHEESNKSTEVHSEANASSPVNASNSSVQIVNEAAYQTAQALSSRALELYKEIKSMSMNSTAAESVQNGLVTLKSDVDKKVSFDTVDGLIDDTITPSLNSSFDLKLKTEG